VADWVWREQVGPAQLAAIFGCLSLSLVLIFAGVFDALGHALDREQVAAATVQATAEVPLAVETDHFAFEWRTVARGASAHYRWNVSVRLETAAGQVVVEGTAAWEENVTCTPGGAGGTTCPRPDPVALMSLRLERGQYRLRIEVLEPNASAGQAVPAADLTVWRSLPLPALAVGLMTVGAAVGAAWVLPLGWWLRRQRRLFEVSNAALSSGAVPSVVEPPGRGGLPPQP
jgi:hypothetical protein